MTILIGNIALGRSVIESMLFALSISIGMTPQLLPGIVTVSLSTGAKRLAERKVIVRRLVAIEDFGNIDVFFTDKTGTLTEGRISFAATLDPRGQPTMRSSSTQRHYLRPRSSRASRRSRSRA